MFNLILFGSIVGILATVFSRSAKTGLLGAMLLGSVGAISGSFIANLLFESGTGSISKAFILLLTLASSFVLVFLRSNFLRR